MLEWVVVRMYACAYVMYRVDMRPWGWYDEWGCCTRLAGVSSTHPLPPVLLYRVPAGLSRG